MLVGGDGVVAALVMVDSSPPTTTVLIIVMVTDTQPPLLRPMPTLAMMFIVMVMILSLPWLLLADLDERLGSAVSCSVFRKLVSVCW
jgi:hypothetical protein